MPAHYRRAVTAWFGLIALSAAMAIAADVQTGARLGPLMIAAVGAVVLLKARLILADYLDLRGHPGVLAGFVGGVALVIVVVCASFFL